MKKNLVFCLSSMILLASCSDDVKNAIDTPLPISPVATQTTDGALKYMEFTASTGADTRTQLTANNDVVWVANDSISIFDGTANRKFTTKDSGASAVFGGEAKYVEAYYALYPYQAGATIENNVIKNVSIPVVQEAKAGSFDGGVNLSVASASTDLQLAFKNVGSLVKFSMSSDKAADVRSVKLTSNDGTAVLAGTVNITVGATPTVTASNSQSQVTIQSNTGFEKDKSYYFMVLPGTLSEGFSLTFTDKDNLTWQKTYTTEATMNRSNILRLNEIELGTFTSNLLTNLNLIAAAEASTGQSFTKNADGTVSLLNNDNKAIVEAVTTLDVENKNDATIADELSFFTGLKVLKCSGNNIVSLDLSTNTALEELECTGKEKYIKNELDDDQFDGFIGSLTSINFGANNALRTVNIQGNNLTSLDLSGVTGLKVLNCMYNKLTSIDLSANTALEMLWINNNPIGTLDLSHNNALTYLNAGACDLNVLDLSHNTELIKIEVANNNYATVDFSHNTKLNHIEVGGNSITNVNLSNITLLETFICYWSSLSTINLSNNTNLKYLKLDFNSNLGSLDISQNNKLEYLSMLCCSVAELNTTNNTLLSYLDVQHNKITSLDVSNNTKLYWLGCNHNEIDVLDVSMLNNFDMVVGSQHDADNNSKEITLYVNTTQFNREPGSGPYFMDKYQQGNQNNVNYIVKSSATHEGYNENNYGN